MLVPNARMDEALVGGQGSSRGHHRWHALRVAQHRPAISKGSGDKIQGLINKGIEEGATAVAAGGLGNLIEHRLLRKAHGAGQRQQR